MRYIDLEKLKAEIEKRIEEAQSIYKSSLNPFWSGQISAFKGCLNIIESLQQDETQVDRMLCSQVWWEEQGWIMIPPNATIEGINSLLRQVKKKLQQEQPEVDLEKFTDKMDTWKARYNYPDNIPIKATMAFTARMFYQYPNIARQWYDNLPKATMD